MSQTQPLNEAEQRKFDALVGSIAKLRKDASSKASPSCLHVVLLWETINLYKQVPIDRKNLLKSFMVASFCHVDSVEYPRDAGTAVTDALAEFFVHQSEETIDNLVIPCKRFILGIRQMPKLKGERLKEGCFAVDLTKTIDKIVLFTGKMYQFAPPI